MEKIKAILVDDEKASRFDLNEALEKYPDIEIIKECKNGEQGLEAINRDQPDLVFVDIDMPIMNGIDMLSKLNYEPIIIFCTGQVKYGAADVFSIKLRTTDFITKPIDPDKFEKAIKRAFDDLKNKQQSERISEQKISVGYIPLATSETGKKITHLFPPNDILYFKGFGDYLQVHLSPSSSSRKDKNISQIEILKTMKTAAQEFGIYGFIQIHKSYLINSNYFEKHSSDKLFLKGVSDPLPIGRAYKDKFKEKLMWFL